MTPLQNAFEGLATEPKQNTEIARLESIRDRLPASLSLDGGLKVALLNPPADPETGLAKQAKLEEVRTLLEGVATEGTLEAIRVLTNTLAKDASVDNVEAALVTLNSKDFATAAKQTSMEALLTQIATNTGTAAVDIANLELQADQIDLNTDQLETILTSLNGKDFATAANQVTAQATLSAINTKLGGTLTVGLPSGAATEAKQDSILSALGGTIAVSGPLTNAQLAAAGLATSAKQDAQTALLGAGLPSALDGSNALRAAIVSHNLPLNTGRLSVHVENQVQLTSGSIADAATLASVNLSHVGARGWGWDAAGSVWRRVKVDSAGNLVVEGQRTPADGFANPTTGLNVLSFLMGYNGTTWDRLRVDGSQRLSTTSVYAGTSYSTSSDGVTPATFAVLPVGGYVFNGTSWDRQRGNQDAGLLTSAARTATTVTADQTNHNGKGVHVVLDLTAFVTAASVTVKLQGKDAFGNYYDLTTPPAALTAVGKQIIELYPGASAAASGEVTQRTSAVLPRVWRVVVTHGNANSHTYRVAASVIT
jgi:hypothetical protein